MVNHSWAGKPSPPPSEGDNILSSNIKEADGTSGQDTNSGSGIKTAHIQDGAVNNSKLAPEVSERIAALEQQVIELSNRLASVEANPVLGLGPFISIELGDLDWLQGPHFVFTGANLHIRSGSGLTLEQNPTGRGNLIIGYNELGPSPAGRDGSHNLVVGMGHTYLGSGGLVAGYANRIYGFGSVAVGGTFNTANGNYSTVSGGIQNTAFGTQGASVFGGTANQALTSESVVVGGLENSANKNWSVVVGGKANNANGYHSVVTGGNSNNAEGQYSTVSGGLNRFTPGIYDWAAGNLWEDQ